MHRFKNYCLPTWFFLVLLFLSISCEENEEIKPAAGKGTVTFSFVVKKGDSQVNNSDKATRIVLIVENQKGDPVSDLDTLSLQKSGDSLVTEPVSLDAGNFLLTSYLVLDSSKNVIYASAKEESSKAPQFSDPLPVSFSIDDGKATGLVPEVITTEGSLPGDFGYAFDAFTESKTFDFLIEVLFFDSLSSSLTPTVAHLTIKLNSAELHSDSTGPGTTAITLHKWNKFTVIVNKAGFAPFEEDFTRQELMMHSDGGAKGPLSVVLVPLPPEEFIRITVDKNTDPLVVFGLMFSIFWGEKYLVSWGDNEVDTIVSNFSDLEEVSHTYEVPDVYEITINNIDNLSGLEFYYPGNNLVNLNLSKAGLIKTLYINSNPSLTSLDVSNNPELRYLYIDHCGLKKLDVSKNTKLLGLSIAHNDLDNLDISNNLSLQTLRCWRNNLVSLDISKNLFISRLICGNNKLTQLDIAHLSALNYLDYGGNGISNLDISGNLQLEVLKCGFTGISTLDVTKHTKLRILDCGTNNISTLDVSNNPLIWLKCDGNSFDTAAIDKILCDILESTQASPREGRIDFARSTAAPSAPGLLKVDTLRKDFNWTITFD